MAGKSWNKGQKTSVDGYNFPSKLHAAVYCCLKLLEQAGKISANRWKDDYRQQPRAFQVERGKHECAVNRASHQELLVPQHEREGECND